MIKNPALWRGFGARIKKGLFTENIPQGKLGLPYIENGCVFPKSIGYKNSIPGAIGFSCHPEERYIGGIGDSVV